MREILSVTLISFTLCLMVVMPAAANEDSFDWAHEEMLTIYGNANLDDIIDENDLEYVRAIINGTENKTQFADANYDGKIDKDDIAQIAAIIAGNETELTIQDMAGRAVTVPRPIKRVVSAAGRQHESSRVSQRRRQDRGLGSYSTTWSPINYAAPKLANVTVVGSTELNIEQIAMLKPDVIFVGTRSKPDEIQKKTHIPTVGVLSGIDSCLAFGMVRTIGWVMGREDRAEELVSYADKKLYEVTNITSKIPEDEKPRVYSCSGLHEGITTALGYKLVTKPDRCCA